MATLPDASVDLVLTSPPFLALRSYLPDDDPNKDREIGQEATPAEFLDTLLALTAEWGRLLAPHGSIAVELGDTYASHDASPGGANPAYGADRHAERAAGSAVGRRLGSGWPLAKSLCGIPTLYAWSLAYGRNLLTGEESPAGRWRIRNVVAWVRPNPPVGALGDKFRPATSYITMATQARDRWFDLDAVRTEPACDRPRGSGSRSPSALSSVRNDTDSPTTSHGNPAGAPPLDWWEVSPEAYSGSHYATWPRKLLTRPIEAMCPQHVCRTCGEPRRRLVESCRVVTQPRRASNAARSDDPNFGNQGHTTYSTLGWTDCGHDDYRRGIVLDPFAGSGTTLAVATGLGRDAIGIDLDTRNADLARERVGMFLEVAS
jgi:site-specific DNA-methyltransferase (adenine-specific)